MYHVTFNGLENVAFEFSPVAFTLFGKEIYWYGVVITIGIILSAIYAFWRAKKLGIRLDDMYDYAIFIIIFGVIGARAYYVLTTLQTHQYKSFLDVIAVWNGGLAIYGGIIAGIITVIIVSKVKKIKILRVLDAIAPAVMIGQALGRWGNYLNQEAFGCNTTLPWGMKSWVVQSASSGNRLEGTVEYLTSNKASIEAQGMTVDVNGFVHPTFLYECLWNVLGFILINIFFKKRKFDGQMFLMYITWYGIGRAFIEMLRTDSLYIPGTPIRISMLVGFLCFAGGIAAMIVLGVRAKKDPEKVLENDMAKLAEFSRVNNNVDFAGRIVWAEVKDRNGNPLLDSDGNPKLTEVFNFGKHKGIPVADVLHIDPGYYSWILSGDFTYNTKQVLTRIRLRESKLNG